ncbi:MAG: hypothetical protein V1799_14490 [bacterium]
MNKLMNIKKLTRLIILMSCCTLLSVICTAQTETVTKKKEVKENSETVWKLQAQSVSNLLGLSEDQTTKLTKAYLAARTGHKQSLKELPEEKDKDKSRIATQLAIEKDCEKFVSALKGNFSDELIAKLTQTLGSFNTRWDGYAATLLDLKLEKAKMTSAMQFLIKYVTEYETASKESIKSFNRRPNSRPFKEKLDTDLSGLLTAEQLAAWKEATASTSGKDKTATNVKNSSKEKADTTKKQ